MDRSNVLIPVIFKNTNPLNSLNEKAVAIMGKKKYPNIEYQIIIQNIFVTPFKSAKEDDLKFIESALHKGNTTLHY
jgi:hypothetical protein